MRHSCSVISGSRRMGVESDADTRHAFSLCSNTGSARDPGAIMTTGDGQSAYRRVKTPTSP